MIGALALQGVAFVLWEVAPDVCSMVRRLEGLSSSTAAISSATSNMLVDSSLPALLAAGAAESSCATCTFYIG